MRLTCSPSMIGAPELSEFLTCIMTFLAGLDLNFQVQLFMIILPSFKYGYAPDYGHYEQNWPPSKNNYPSSRCGGFPLFTAVIIVHSNCYCQIPHLHRIAPRFVADTCPAKRSGAKND